MRPAALFAFAGTFCQLVAARNFTSLAQARLESISAAHPYTLLVHFQRAYALLGEGLPHVILEGCKVDNRARTISVAGETCFGYRECRSTLVRDFFIGYQSLLKRIANSWARHSLARRMPSALSSHLRELGQGLLAFPACSGILDLLHRGLPRCWRLLDDIAFCAQQFDTTEPTEKLYTILAIIRSSTWPHSFIMGYPRIFTSELTFRAALLVELFFNQSSQRETEGKHQLLGAEIGIDDGDTSVAVLHHIKNLRLLLVDPFTVEHHPPGKAEEVHSRLLPYIDRATFVRQTSVEAARWLREESLDVVFIDGDHSREAVRDDIQAWWPLVRKGGVLAGHDYTWNHPGLVASVNEFSVAFGLQLHLTSEVFWVFKPDEETHARVVA